MAEPVEAEVELGFEEEEEEEGGFVEVDAVG